MIKPAPATLLQRIFGREKVEPEVPSVAPAPRAQVDALRTLDLPPNDPLVAYFQNVPGVVDISTLNLDSPALRELKKENVRLVVPLVSQGELLGVIHLGPRLSEQDYSSDDRVLLNNLATQAAPALRVAQLVHQQQLEALARERLENELRVARLVQQTLLPQELPSLEGWHVAAHYRPARTVGGDFYDFLYLADGRLGLIVGDVTDKGVPAALVMASARATLRGVAHSYTDPGEVLARVNDLIVPDIPPKMFITCLYAILDPHTGIIRYANAGHDLPYHTRGDQSFELRATGMPLGLLPGMDYEVKEVQLEPGDTVLFYSDGLVEAHNPSGEMYGFPRLAVYTATHPGGTRLIESLLEELETFTGPHWEQEDDVMLVTLERKDEGARMMDEEGGNSTGSSSPNSPSSTVNRQAFDWQSLTAFAVPSAEGNEREVMQRVAAAVEPLKLSSDRVEKLKTAVAEATMNAMEHGNKNNPDLPVQVDVRASSKLLSIHITDMGGSAPIPDADMPDLDAKLAGMQSPRGWGLFLIKQFVDEMNVITDEQHHTLELIWHLDGKE